MNNLYEHGITKLTIFKVEGSYSSTQVNFLLF